MAENVWSYATGEHGAERARIELEQAGTEFERKRHIQTVLTLTVEQQIVVNVIFTGKLCHADAGLHRLRHQSDFEVAGEVGASWSFAGDRDFAGRRDYGKNGRFSGCLSVKAFIQIFCVDSWRQRPGQTGLPEANKEIAGRGFGDA